MNVIEHKHLNPFKIIWGKKGNFHFACDNAKVKVALNVIPTRFERVTHSLEGCCSIQLSYGTNPMPA